MKGSIGLIIAAGLGLLAVAVNWVYLSQKTEGSGSVAFIGVRDGVNIKVGDLIKKDQLVRVPVPKKQADQLKKFVYLYDEINTVVGAIKATRPLSEGDLIFRKDYRTAPTEITFEGENKSWMVVPIDSNRVVTALIDPGDQVYFIAPTRPEVKESQGTQDDLIGPFTVAAMGSRLGSREASRGGSRSRAERLITVFIKLKGKRFDGEAKKLNDAIIRNSGRGMGVLPYVPESK